jgi:hypothetical protein
LFTTEAQRHGGRKVKGKTVETTEAAEGTEGKREKHLLAADERR